MLLLTNTANAQVSNNVNLLPDTGNVGIGTANPTEKLQVNGNSKLDGSVSVTDSLSVGTTLSVGSSLIVQDSLTVGTKMIVNENVVIADSLKVGSTISATEIKGTEIIKTELLSTKEIVGNNGVIVFGKEGGDPATGCDTTLVVDYCARKIYGKSASSSMPYPGVSIGFNSQAIGNNSFAVGNNARAWMENSIAIGSYIRSVRKNSITIGSGTGSSNFFTNTTENCLMIGFNQSTDVPSLFVGPSTISNLPGNVGIGTMTPGDKLVIGEGYEQISFGSAMNSDAGWAVGYIGMNAVRTRTGTWQASTWTVSPDGNNALGGSVIKTEADGKMVFIPIKGSNLTSNIISDTELNNRRMMVLYPGEYNAVNETMGGGVLSVNGNIVCRDLEVTLSNWWDEVFNPDYSLMTIADLQKYISENGHLPGVPSESEVVGQTMSVQEMNLILLKKVEELSLYVIELQKQIDEMKNQK